MLPKAGDPDGAGPIGAPANGDAIFTNPLVLGFAWQKGWIPLTYDALIRAIELNGVAVEKNKTAFEWGRRCAHDLKAVQSLYAAQAVIQLVKRQSVDEIVAKRVDFLTGYQNAASAADYRAFVDKVAAAENEKLKRERLETEFRLQRLAALETENERLRRLFDSTERVGLRALVAEIPKSGMSAFTGGQEKGNAGTLWKLVESAQ